MAEPAVIIPCRITPEVFRAFALFDTFRRQKRWRSPLLFTSIFVFCALICLTLGRRLEQSGLIAAVLLLVGLILPVVYFATFLFSVSTQSKNLGLERKEISYTLRLDQSGFTAQQREEKVSWTWEEVPYVYRLPQCVCLYPNTRQAFLLPQEEKELERAWKLIAHRVPAEKLFDLRG